MQQPRNSVDPEILAGSRDVGMRTRGRGTVAPALASLPGLGSRSASTIHGHRQSPCSAAICRSSLVLLAATTVLAACVSYVPAPIDTGDVAAVQRSRRIDRVGVETELARIAPAYAWRDDRWNSLTLLAAAIATNAELAQSRAAVAAARAEAAAARVSPGPSFTLTTEYAFNSTEPSSWLYGLASDLLVDRGGRKAGRIDLADIAAEASLLEYATTVWTVRAKIRRALDARRTWQAEATLAHRLVAMREREFAAVSRRVAAGAASRLELDRVRADAADAVRTEAVAQGNVTDANLDLAAALGVPLDGLDLERIDTREPALPVNPVTVTDTQIIEASTGRTEILQAMVAYDKTEASLRVAVASQYPELRIGAGYTWERGLKKLPFALSLGLPTSDRARTMIRAAEARRTTAGRQVEAAVAAVAASIARAQADYRAAWAVLDLVRQQALPTAESLARQADRELAAGSINRADWAASQAGLLTAKLDEVAAGRGTLAAEATLEDALRHPLRGPETGVRLALPGTDNAESDR